MILVEGDHYMLATHIVRANRADEHARRYVFFNANSGRHAVLDDARVRYPEENRLVAVDS